MKKIVALSFVLMMVVVGFSGCGTKKTDNPPKAEQTIPAETKEDEIKSDQSKQAETFMDKLKAKGNLVLGTCADYPPYETHVMIDGKDEIVGFDIEIGKEIAKALGVELKIEDMDFDSLLVALESGKVDVVIAGMSATEERAKAVDFSSVYYNPTQKIVIRKADADVFKTLESFKDKTVGVQKGTIQEEFANETMPDAKKVALGKIPNLVMELKNKKTDGLVLEEPVAVAYVSKNEDLMISDVNVVIAEDSGSSIAMKKGNPEFVAFVNKIIDQLVKEKKIDQMVIEANKLMEQE